MGPIALVEEISLAEFGTGIHQIWAKHFPSATAYEEWRKGLETLEIFWTQCPVWSGFIRVQHPGNFSAVCRLQIVPVRDRRHWGEKYHYRGEIQDICLHPPSAETLEQLIQAAERNFTEKGISLCGISTWDPSLWPLLEALGWQPYARSVILEWDIHNPPPKKPHPTVQVRPWANPNNISLLRRIQQSSWGFFIPPDFRHQVVLVAWLEKEAVGSVYVNTTTGNMDFGIHVKKEKWRQHIGTTLFMAALQFCRKRGLPRLSVVRVLRALSRWNPMDKQALCFYTRIGGQLWWEIRGYRLKKRPRSLHLPAWTELHCKDSSEVLPGS